MASDYVIGKAVFGPASTGANGFIRNGTVPDDKVALSMLSKRIAALEAENARMREAAIDVAASLAAAISLLERTPKAKKAAPSDRMFAQMLDDYRASLERARAAIR